MSKYNKGDKFIIELDEQVGDLWKIKGFNALVFDDFGLDRLGQLVQGVDKFSYNKGAEDAWELVRKIEELPISDLEDIFGEMFIGHMEKYSELYDVNTYAEAAEKVEEWEKEKSEIRVGDVVKVDELQVEMVVIAVYENNTIWTYDLKPGSFAPLQKFTRTKLIKTDRHIDIEAVLAQIK